MGSSADVPGVRNHAMLRRLSQSPRDTTCQGEQAPGDRIGGTGRAMALLLPGRCV